MSNTSLLLLHHRYTPDDQAIWKVAIGRKWRTERIGVSGFDIERKILGAKHIRYYGDTLHYDMAKDLIPVKCIDIDLTNLTKLPEFTKRRVELVRAGAIANPVRENIFLKCPGTKWIESRVYKSGEGFQLKNDDYLYAQSIVKIKDEIRCFVFDGEIVTCSQYYNSEHLFEIGRIENPPEIVREMVRKIYAKLPWPAGIVFDFGVLDSGEWCFIEANEAWCSGLYDCDPEKCFDVICASQTRACMSK